MLPCILFANMLTNHYRVVFFSFSLPDPIAGEAADGSLSTSKYFPRHDSDFSLRPRMLLLAVSVTWKFIAVTGGWRGGEREAPSPV